MRYLHAVFTLPHILSQLALQNKELLYSLLMRASAQTLLEVARDPRRLGAEIGFLSILHTWNQRLQEHAHAHCVVPAGGLSLDHSRWIDAPSKNFFLPKRVLAEVFRGKFVGGLKKAFAKGKLRCHGRFAPLNRERNCKAFVRSLYRTQWVVEVRPPFGGPGKALEYLSRYTHRVAISNQRLVSFEQGQVTFRWRDSAHGNRQRLMTLELYEFLRRFLLHVLPSGFVRIRYYGFLANSKRGALLPLCRRFIVRVNPSRTIVLSDPEPAHSSAPLCTSLRRPLTLGRTLQRSRVARSRPACSRRRMMPHPLQLQPLPRFGVYGPAAPRSFFAPSFDHVPDRQISRLPFRLAPDSSQPERFLCFHALSLPFHPHSSARLKPHRLPRFVAPSFISF